MNFSVDVECIIVYAGLEYNSNMKNNEELSISKIIYNKNHNNNADLE